MVVNRPPPVPRNVSSVTWVHVGSSLGSVFDAVGHGPAVAFDIVALAIGLVTGGIAVAVVMEAMGRAREQPAKEDPSKLTSGWRLRELGAPILVARDVVDVQVPDNCRIYASGLVDPDVLARCRVQQVPAVRAEFAFDATNHRAIVFTSGVREGALALITVDSALVGRLETEYRTLAQQAGDYVERLKIRDLAGKAGVTVETRGVVQNVLPFQDRFMLRLEDQGSVIGVLCDRDPSELEGQRVQVRGPLQKRTGYPVIEAKDIRRIR